MINKIVFLLIAFLFCLPIAASEFFSGWYSAKMYGKKTAYLHLSYQKSTKGYEISSLMQMSLKREKDVFNYEHREHLYIQNDLTPIRMEETSVQGGQTIFQTTQFFPTEIHRRTRINGNEHKEKISFTGHVTLDENLFFWDKIQKGEWRVGADFSYQVLLTESLELASSTVFVKDKIVPPASFSWDYPYVWVVTIATKNSSTQTMWLTPEGMPLRSEIPDLQTEFFLTNRSDAIQIDQGVELKVHFPTNYQINAEQAVHKMMVHVVADRIDLFRKVLVNNAYQSIKWNKDSLELTLHENNPRPRSLLYPESSSELQVFLAASPYIQCHDSQIKKAARNIVLRSKDRYQAVKKIQRWIFYNLKKSSTSTAYASSLETLRSKEGDCTEHSTLFCALTRSLGIPSRVCYGLVYLDGYFSLHAWNEVFIGRWILIDSTLMREGAKGKYVLFGLEEDHQKFESLVSYLLTGAGKFQLLRFWRYNYQKYEVAELRKNYSLSELEQAIQKLEQDDIRQQKKSVHLYFQLASKFLEMDQPDKAYPFLRKALSFDRYRPKYQFLYGVLSCRFDETEKAQVAFQFVIDHGQDIELKNQAAEWLDKITNK